MNIIILGAPGAGKGTQSTILSEKLEIPTISTGQLLRNLATSDDSLGSSLHEYMSMGKLVPDDMVMGVIKNRLSAPDCVNGYILDGIPRTLSQAKQLTQFGVNIDKVVFLDIPTDIILNRMWGRRQCLHCGAVYHVQNLPPKVEDVCDLCNNLLVKRKDDEIEVMTKRLDVFQKETAPLIAHYKENGSLLHILGKGSVEDISNSILTALDIVNKVKG